MTQYKFDDIAFNSKAKKKPVEQDKETYIGLEHLDPKCLHVNRFGSEVAPIGEKLLMKKGDVLFGKRRAYQKKVAIAPFDGIFSAHGMVLRPKEDIIDKDFFPFFISSDYFLNEAIKISVGSLSPTINWGDLKELKFNLSPLVEQKKLAKALWAAEKTRQGYKSILVKTDELIKSKFNEMFNGINLLDELSILCEKGISNITIQKSENDYGAYPLYGASGYLKNISIYESQNEYIGLVKDGSVGKMFILPAKSSIINTMQYIFPKDNCNIYYLFYLLKYLELSNDATGAIIPHIYFKDYSKKIVPIPNLNLQNKFAEFVKQAEQSKLEIQQSLDDLNAMTSALINENLK